MLEAIATDLAPKAIDPVAHQILAVNSFDD